MIMDLCNLMQFNLSDFGLSNDTQIEFTESIASQVELVVRKLFPPLLILVGIPGNILTFMCMSRLSSDHFPLCGYLCLVAVLDCVMLFIQCGNEWLHQVSLQDIVHTVTTHSDTSCKLYNFGHSLTQHHNVWISVSFTIECIVLMYYPAKLQHITSTRLRDTMAFISVLLICANCHYFWTFGINKVEMNYGCTHYVKEFCSFQTRTLQGQLVAGAEDTGFLWSTLHLLLATLVPAAIFLILFALYLHRHKAMKVLQLEELLHESITLKLMRNRENQANGQPYERQGVKMNSCAISQLIWRTMPTLCILFLVCHIPLFVHKTLELNTSLHGENGDAWSLTGVMFDILKNMSYSIKLFVYLATCKQFRKTAKALIKEKCKSTAEACTLDGYTAVHRRSSKVDVHLPHTSNSHV